MALTLLLGADLVLLELHPAPVGELVDEDGRQKDLGDGPREGPVELFLSATSVPERLARVTTAQAASHRR